jgi:hypothetical protein
MRGRKVIARRRPSEAAVDSDVHTSIEQTIGKIKRIEEVNTELKKSKADVCRIDRHRHQNRSDQIIFFSNGWRYSPLKSAQISHDFLDFLQNLAGLHQLLHAIVIGI